MSSLRSISDMHEYQTEAVSHCRTHPQSMVWLSMGLGKTIITLTSILERFATLEVYGVLIIAPLRVVETVWKQESRGWYHTTGLSFASITGTEDQRRIAMVQPTHIKMVNYENLSWLVDELIARYLRKGYQLPFNMIVYDEVSKLKAAGTIRHQQLQQILPWIPYRIGLTGTPAANGYKDLFGQYYAIDSGMRLGQSKGDFESAYFRRAGYGLEVTDSGKAALEAKISDITLQMDKKDYIDSEDPRFNDIWVNMPAAAYAKYQQLERDMFIELDDASVEVFNKASLTNKCLQAANGAMYLEPGEPAWSKLHDAKLDALEDIIEEAAGQPILCCYGFKHDLARIKKRFPQAVCVNERRDTAVLVDEWTDGKIPLLVGHPGSMGHGLNLQYGGYTFIWFGLNWSLDLYQQAMARLDRQGQTTQVVVHRILTTGTLDLAVKEALDKKDDTQRGLRAAIKQYQRQRISHGY